MDRGIFSCAVAENSFSDSVTPHKFYIICASLIVRICVVNIRHPL